MPFFTPPLGKLDRWRSSFLLPYVSGDKRQRKEREKD